MKLLKYAFVLCCAAVVLWAPPARAVQVFEDKDKGVALKIGVLLQPWFQLTSPGSRGGTGPCGSATRTTCSAGIGSPEGGPSYDFYLRRTRLLLYGSATKQLSFFVETDEPNLGKGGAYATTTFIQDAFLSYAFAPEITLDAGLMLVPLSHHTIEGATGLNGLDYHAEMIRFSTGRIWRDVGVQLRGMLLDDHLHYRLGVFEGVRNSAVPAPPMPPVPPPPPLNERGLPRVTAHVRGNILGSEKDFFVKGIYFSETPIVSVGVGVDFQSNAMYKVNGDRRKYLALSGDVFAELPFGDDMELVGKAAAFYYAEGTLTIGSSNLPQGGITAFGEVGFRIAWIEPIVSLDYLQARKNPPPAPAEPAVKVIAPHGGVNFWIDKYTLNVKTDVGYRRVTRPTLATTKDVLWTTQMQLFF